MFRGAVRLVLRVAGWLLTPLILVIAAMLGASIGLLAAPALSPNMALAVSGLLALAAAAVALRFWMRLLRRHPELRHTLSMTTEGIPESEVVERIIHPAEPTDADGR